MKSKLKMHIKIFGVIKINSIIVNIQKTPHILIQKSNKKVIVNLKDEVSGILVNGFIGLRSNELSLMIAIKTAKI